MNLFIRECKTNRKALIIWSICMMLLVLSGMGKYTAYSSGGTTGDLLNKMPFTLKVLLGIGTFDVTTMSGYFTFLFPYIEITAAIHAALLGSSILAKEERDKTTEFLMVKPISRTVIITSKLLVSLINIIILNIVTLISSIMMVSVYNKGKDITREILLFYVSLFFVQLIFLSMGTFLSAFMRKPKASGSIAISILLGVFTISKITDFSDKLNFLNIISPFKYFSYEDIVFRQSISTLIIILCLLLTIGFIYFTYFFYQKRDLNI